MQIELTASVYSVASVAYRDTDRLKRYLYDHTTIVDLPGYSIAEGHAEPHKIIPVILKTTASQCIEADADPEAVAVTIARAFFLANYQLDRLTSGGMGGLLAGTEQDARELAIDVLT